METTHAPRKYFEWLGGHSVLVLIAVLAVVMGTWGFVELLDEVRAGKTRGFDEWAIRVIDQHRGPPWMEEVGRDITALGGVTVLLLVTAAVVGYMLIRRKYGAMWLMIVATVGGILLVAVLKESVNRNRPNIGTPRMTTYSQSFPSGHSTLSAVVYLTLGSMLAHMAKDRLVKWYFLLVALVLTFLVGVSRVYMEVHWPTDVLAGWAVGLVWALICWLVTRYLQRRGTVEWEWD